MHFTNKFVIIFHTVENTMWYTCYFQLWKFLFYVVSFESSEIFESLEFNVDMHIYTHVYII